MHSIVIYAIILGLTSEITLATNSSICFDEVLCIPSNYSKSVRPYLKQPNNILVQLNKLKVIKVSDFDSTIRLSLELLLQWKDSRIIISEEENLEESKILILNKDLLDLLWIPEIYVYDLHNIKKHSLIQASENLILIKNNSSLQYRVELEISIYCPEMNFANYPLDWHICYLRIGSYSYDLNTLNYTMKSLQLYPNMVSSLDYLVEISELNRSKRIKEYGSSKYSIVGCGIRLDRNLRKYMMNYYIPSGLLVTASWPSFVIPTDSVPGRMGLLVTLFLCLLSLLNNITSKAPNTESITSITIWLIVCIFFVHCALLEYGCILVYKHLKLDWDPMADQKVKIKKIIGRFDLFCSIVSIVLFIIFNLFFWTLMT